MDNQKKEVLMLQIEHPGIIPVLRLDDTQKIFPLLDALLEGGINCAELTMTMPSAILVLEQCRKRYSGKMILGMGTILEADQAADAISAGAQFLVSPLPAFAALSYAKKHQIPFLMGAFSPAEVYEANKAGADYVKVFPINCLQTHYIKELKGPLPGIKFIPTGGITLDQVEALFNVGVSAMGVGGAMVNKKCIENSDWGEITKRAQQFVGAARKHKERQGDM